MALKLKKNDRVKVIAGKSKGKEGRVIRVLAADAAVLVEGVNRAKRHSKPSRRNEKGGILEKEMPIHVSNVMLISPKSNQPVRVSKRVENGKRVRVEKKTGAIID